jgi:hypothetical protein
MITHRLSNVKDTRHALLLYEYKKRQSHRTCKSTAGAIECVDAVKKRLKKQQTNFSCVTNWLSIMQRLVLIDRLK